MKFLEVGDSLLNFDRIMFIQRFDDPPCIKYFRDSQTFMVSKFETIELRDEEYENVKTRILWPESYGLCP